MTVKAKVTVNKNMIPINMFSERNLDHIEVLMKPGRSSREGFLSDDECIIDVCAADWTVVKKLNLTFEQFADKLETVIGKARRKAHLIDQNGKKDYWDIVKNGVVVDGLKVTWTSYLGYQNCPCCHFNNDINKTHWCGPQETLSDTDFTVTNVKTKQHLFFSELHIHLIRRHHFFEGHTKYRLDPKKCAAVLGLKPGISYKPVYSTEMIWSCTSGSSGGGRTFKDYIKEKEVVDFIKAGAKKILCQQTHVWILNNRLLTISDKSYRKPMMIEGAIMSYIYCGMNFFERYEHKFVSP
jgi:hypothetical protein